MMNWLAGAHTPCSALMSWFHLVYRAHYIHFHFQNNHGRVNLRTSPIILHHHPGNWHANKSQLVTSQMSIYNNHVKVNKTLLNKPIYLFKETHLKKHMMKSIHGLSPWPLWLHSPPAWWVASTAWGSEIRRTFFTSARQAICSFPPCPSYLSGAPLLMYVTTELMFCLWTHHTWFAK